MKFSPLLLCVLWIAQPAAAMADGAPASPAQLAAITARGRALEAYDQAAWHGTDAAQAVANGNTAGLKYFIAQKTSGGWAVDFGNLDPSGATFLTVLEATSQDGLHFTARRFTPPRGDTGFLVAAAHAMARTEAVFRAVPRTTYNVAVLPNPDGTMYVYFYPAQTDPKVFPLGGDERFTVSADGAKILDAHRMHNGIINQDLTVNAPQGGHITAGFHTVVVENVPQDTDVFHVLARTPAIPDYVDAQGQLYLISIDGSIEYKGPAGAKP